MSDSPLAPLSVRERFMTEPGLGAGNFLQYALDNNPHLDAPLVYDHHTDERGHVTLRGYSLRELGAVRDRFAHWYRSNGVRPGEPVALYIAEGLQPILHFLALTALGAIPALVNDAMPVTTARRYLDHVGVVGVVADDPRPIAATYAPGQERPRFIVPSSEIRAHEAPQGGRLEQYPYRHAPDDVVALIHSSGTTGTPKSTQVAQRQFWVGKESRMVRFPAEPYDRLLSLMPHTHAGGLSYLLTTILLGLPTLTMGDWRRSAVEPVMKVFRPTMVASFPRTFVELAEGRLPVEGAAKVHTWFNTGDGAHYGHIRRLVGLGERPSGLIQPWLLPRGAAEDTVLPGSRFIDGLGSSEMGMALFGQVTTPESTRDDRCVGLPVEVVEKAAVLDDDGNEVPDGTVGLLGVRTPTRTPGYWNDAALTKSFELAGYWLTGDVAVRKPDGRFYHLDRTSDVIHTSRGPVYSLPLEEVLIADCAELVHDCAVVGVPAPDGDGHLPVAVIRAQADSPVSARDSEKFLDAVNQKLEAAGLHPLAAVLAAESDADYPTGPTGKVLKRELRDRHAAALTGAPAA